MENWLQIQIQKGENENMDGRQLKVAKDAIKSTLGKETLFRLHRTNKSLPMLRECDVRNLASQVNSTSPYR